MKKVITAVLLFSLLLLSACGNGKGSNSATFYFPINPNHEANHSSETFYATEKREHNDDPQDLWHYLSIYLQGPLDESMITPFPESTQLVDLEILEDRVVIHLSEEFSQLSGIKLTTACACLSLTAFDLTGAEAVTITSPATGNLPGVDITIGRTDLVLTDTIT